MDGDGSAGDLTAFYASGSIGMLMAWDDVNGDVVCGEDLRNLGVVGGDLSGDVVCGGSLGRLEARALDRSGKGGRAGGNVFGDVSVSGSIRELTVVVGDLVGNVTSSGNIGRVSAIPVWEAATSTWRGGGGGGGGGSIHTAGHVSVLEALGTDGVTGDLVADEGVRRERVAAGLARSVAGPGGLGGPCASGSFCTTSVRAGTLDEVLAIRLLDEGDADGGVDRLFARAGSFWVEGASASDWTTDGERLYFGGFWAWDG